MARDAKGFLYVVDMGNNRILKIDKNGEVVDAIGTFGEGPDSLICHLVLLLIKKVIF